MKKISYVKIIVSDEQKRILEHFYVRAKKWDSPTGKVEDFEEYRTAAKRELLERTGYVIDEHHLIFLHDEESDGITFRVFTSKKINLTHIARPGELGGYITKIRWKQKP